MRLGEAQKTGWPRITRASEARTLATETVKTSRLVRCDFFEIDHLERPETLPSDEPLAFEQPTAGIPLVFICTGGSGMIEGAGESLELFPGRSVLIPASCDVSKIRLQVRDNEKPTLLRVRPADVLDNTLA